MTERTGPAHLVDIKPRLPLMIARQHLGVTLARQRPTRRPAEEWEHTGGVPLVQADLTRVC